MAKASEIKNGSIIRFNGNLIAVEEIIHRTPGNLRAFYQARMRNVKTGKLVEYRFRTDEEVEICRVETKDYQYLYEDGDFFVVMDNETFEQFNIPKFLFGNSAKFVIKGMNLIVAFESDEPITAQAPTHVELLVTYTEPAVKGDTATNVTKSATLLSILTSFNEYSTVLSDSRRLINLLISVVFAFACLIASKYISK